MGVREIERLKGGGKLSGSGEEGEGDEREGYGRRLRQASGRGSEGKRGEGSGDGGCKDNECPGKKGVDKIDVGGDGGGRMGVGSACGCAGSGRRKGTGCDGKEVSCGGGKGDGGSNNGGRRGNESGWRRKWK